MAPLLVLLLATGVQSHPPADVAAFQARRATCDELRGEEPYDAARAREIARRLRRACAGTDRELARLRRTHAGRPAVLARLAGYDAHVE